jgi:hypothetical protein
MSRPKILNPKDEVIMIRMDHKLYIQLFNYAKRKDNGIVSRTARLAIQKFLEEEKSLKS